MHILKQERLILAPRNKLNQLHTLHVTGCTGSQVVNSSFFPAEHLLRKSPAGGYLSESPFLASVQFHFASEQVL